jgi:hypothetical protein
MVLAPAHRRLLVGQALGGFFGNLAFNGALAWLLFPPVTTIPLWARGNCVGGDTFGTSFFMSLITCVVLTPFARRALAPRGAVPPIPREALPAAVRWLSPNVVARGATVGLIAALTVAPVALWALGSAGVTELTRGEVTLWKAVYTALLGVVITPLFGLRALGDAPRAAAPGG